MTASVRGIGAAAWQSHIFMMLRFPVAAVLGLVLASSIASARADQRDPRLDGLFKQLARAESDHEAKLAEVLIWTIWLEHADNETERLMQHGMAAIADDHPAEALSDFTAVIGRDDHFAEAWNKRATVEFLMGDFAASVADIEHTLALEPRHFGALSGLGQIYLGLDRKPAALKAFEAALALNPHLDGVKRQVEALRKELAGDPI
jgi:tetratricopeptide (TPR) repeat protein